jgi:hypothetical protein
MDYPFVSERHLIRDRSGKRHWVTCTECSAVMAAHNANPSIPVTWAEVMALYGGPESHTLNGGSTPAIVDREVAVRYGHKGGRGLTLAALRDALDTGAVATINVDFDKLARPLQSWDREFAKAANNWHALAVGPNQAIVNAGGSIPAGLALPDLYLVRDPLAPDGAHPYHATFEQFAGAIMRRLPDNIRIYPAGAFVAQPTA